MDNSRVMIGIVSMPIVFDVERADVVVEDEVIVDDLKTAALAAFKVSCK